MTRETQEVVCFQCGETGHRVRDCTQERQKREPRTCNTCGSPDHLSKVFACAELFLPSLTRLS
jgi:hypothetical protein